MRKANLIVLALVAIYMLAAPLVGCGGVGGPSGRIITTAFSAPSITELFPSSVRVNSVPFTLTINGVNFGTDSIVFWNNTPHNPIVVTSKQLLVNLTATDLTHAGLVPVFVRTGGLNSNTVDFDVTAQ